MVEINGMTIIVFARGLLHANALLHNAYAWWRRVTHLTFGVTKLVVMFASLFALEQNYDPHRSQLLSVIFYESIFTFSDRERVIKENMSNCWLTRCDALHSHPVPPFISCRMSVFVIRSIEHKCSAQAFTFLFDISSWQVIKENNRWGARS